MCVILQCEIEKLFQAQPDNAPAAVKQLREQVIAILQGSESMPVAADAMVEQTAAAAAAATSAAVSSTNNVLVLSPLHL